MKYFILSILVMNLAFAAEQNPKVGSPSNAVSRGSSENAGISDSPSGLDKKERQEARQRAQSMGGAPNAGAGTATQTGAGSTVGKKIKTDSN